MFQFILSAIAVFIAGLFQLSNIFVFGVKPNIALVLVLSLSLVNKEWIERVILILAACVSLSFAPFFDSEVILSAGILVLGIWLIDNLPWTQLMNLAAVAVTATFAVNVYNFDIRSVLIETIYNLILAAIFFNLIKRNIYESREISSAGLARPQNKKRNHF